MAKALLENLEGLPKELANEYTLVEDPKNPYNGKYLLKVEPVADLVLENVTGLKSALATVKNERDTLKNQIKPFEGLDVEAARSAMAKVAEWGNMTPAQKAEEILKTKEAQLQTKFKAVEETLVKDRDTAVSQLDKHLRVGAIMSEMAKRKIETPDLLLPHALAATKIRKIEGTGEYTLDVVDDKGNPRPSPIGTSMDPMTITQLFDEFKGKYPSAFPADGSSGTGATGGGSGSGTPKGAPGTVKTVSRTDQDGMNRNLEGIAKGTVKVVG